MRQMAWYLAGKVARILCSVTVGSIAHRLLDIQVTDGLILFFRHRPALGECVGFFASCFPVAFLEPDLNKYNKYSILFGLEGKISEHSLEAQGLFPYQPTLCVCVCVCVCVQERKRERENVCV